MKKLSLYVFLVLMFCNNAYAGNFKCEIHSNLSYVIKVDNADEQVLASVNSETGKFFDDNSVIYEFEVLNGEVIEFRGNESKVFNMVVLRNSKIGDASSFRGIYFEESYVHSIRINTWDEDVPIYLYNDWTQTEAKGTCK